MSDMTHTNAAVGLRARPKRMLVSLAIVLAVAAAVLVVALASGSGGSRDAARTAMPHSGLVAPNETLRGQASAEAAGAFVPAPSGGPDETARGQAAASAAGR
jgi:hypothetical protein